MSLLFNFGAQEAEKLKEQSVACRVADNGAQVRKKHQTRDYEHLVHHFLWLQLASMRSINSNNWPRPLRFAIVCSQDGYVISIWIY